MDVEWAGWLGKEHQYTGIWREPMATYNINVLSALNTIYCISMNIV